jgi:hypothetical protein
MPPRSRFRSPMRRRQMPVLLALGCCFFAAGRCWPQGPSASSTTPRDAASLQLLTQALNLSGGAASWQSMHGARVTGTVTANKSGNGGEAAPVSTFIWIDDWSTGHSRYSRTTASATGNTHTLRHGDSATFTAHTPQGATRTMKFDPASILLTHLPAVSLVRILSDTSYSVAKTSQINDPDHNEVLVSKSDGSMAQIWYLSIQTGQVDAVRYTVPDALNSSHHFWSIAIYKHYRTNGGLSVPDHVAIIHPNSLPIEMEFKSLEANPTVSARDFSVGGGQ